MRTPVAFLASFALSIAAVYACGGTKPGSSFPGSSNDDGGAVDPAPGAAGPSTGGGSPDPSRTTTTTDTLGDAGDLADATLQPLTGMVETDQTDDGGAPSGDGGHGSGAHSRREISDLVKARRPQWRACYHDAQKAHPDLPQGQLVLHFVIDQKGTVTEASLGTPSDISEPAVLNCLISVVQAIPFGPSANGRKSIVNYPFIFSH